MAIIHTIGNNITKINLVLKKKNQIHNHLGQLKLNDLIFNIN